MFYAATALLAELEQEYSNHAGVVSAFGREFAATDRMDRKYHAYLLEAFADRQQGDYAIDMEIEPVAAQRHVDRAEEFIAVAEAWIARHDK